MNALLRKIETLAVYSVIGHIFLTSASGTDIGLFIGNYSSLAESGLVIPVALRSCFYPSVTIARHDAVVYGANLSLDVPFWFYPSFRLHLVRQQVNEKHGDSAEHAGIWFYDKCWMSLEASSTTTFLWTDIGVETEIPKRAKNGRSMWRSLVVGAGGSLIYAEDTIHSGSKYAYHYERWGRDPTHDTGPVLLDLKHEEKDLSRLHSSGFGVGWYLLSGLRFRFSRSVSLHDLEGC